MPSWFSWVVFMDWREPPEPVENWTSHIIVYVLIISIVGYLLMSVFNL